MEQGWIKLHRKLLENPISNKPLWGWLWVVLLLKANHNKTEILWNGEKKVIECGSFITGRKSLSQISGLPESTVERVLECLEKLGQIGQQKTNKYRLITITKWRFYQFLDNKRTTKRQQTDTNKNEENENNKEISFEERESIEISKKKITESFKLK